MARTFAWLVLLQANGPLDKLFNFLHLGEPNILGSATAVTIGMAQTLMPFAVFPLFATMRNIDRILLLAARSLGASKYTAFFKIYLPLSEPGIVVSWFLVFVLSLGFYVTPQLLGSTHNALLSQYIAIKISDQLQFGYGSALAVMLLFVTLALLGFISALRRRSKSISIADV
jgi:putative spermidine/putrescine transport system permease protein